MREVCIGISNIDKGKQERRAIKRVVVHGPAAARTACIGGRSRALTWTPREGGGGWARLRKDERPGHIRKGEPQALHAS